MNSRTTRLLYFSVASLALGIVGCGYNKQSKFQSFLPSTPHPSTTPEIAQPPAVQPDLYVHEAPAFLIQAQKEVAVATAAGKADVLMQRADQAYQRGRKLYQEQDEQQARKEFDTAIDLMLEASENNPPDRQTFDARLDEMVDAIHRYGTPN
jgi:hypothetical protein